MERYVCGVDVGGTTVKIGLFDRQGSIVDKWEVGTDTTDNGINILRDIALSIKARMADRGIDENDVIGVGIGAPGPVDSVGNIYKAVNLGWGVFNLAEEFSKVLGGIPVRAGNDANVAALGEMWKGGGTGYRDLVLVTLGTGVGGGVIIDGNILTGVGGAAGEIGHIHVREDESESCNCGNCGCLEQYVSATGIARMARQQLAITDQPSRLRSGVVSAKTVFDAVKAGDPLAQVIAEQFGEVLGKALAVIANTVNPEAFVIGGGVSKAGNILFDYIVPYYNKTVFHACRPVKFTLATLENDAGIYGAAKLVLDYVKVGVESDDQ
ncbi:MAG: ROK family glucokinase [Lachnospiraceae bacterium]|nr:ROK family glucokinase [Lachnospiraceae bacterium]